MAHLATGVQRKNLQFLRHKTGQPPPVVTGVFPYFLNSLSLWKLLMIEGYVLLFCVSGNAWGLEVTVSSLLTKNGIEEG